jgi:AcrR family transcriptional regulator
MAAMPSEVAPRIVEAAARLFADNGYAGTSTHQIASAADVSEGSLFRLFSSKEQLFQAALEYSVRHWRVQVEDFERELNRPDIVAAIHKATALYHAKTRPEHLRLLLFSALETGKKITITTGASAELIAPLIRRIELGKTKGQVAPGIDSTLAAVELTQMALALQVWDLPHGAHQRYVREYVEFWLYGILAAHVKK